jgi:hypothetical protein
VTDDIKRLEQELAEAQKVKPQWFCCGNSPNCAGEGCQCHALKRRAEAAEAREAKLREALREAQKWMDDAYLSQPEGVALNAHIDALIGGRDGQ